MMEKLKALYTKYREPILYVWFGGWTTVVNYVSYLLFADVLKVQYLGSTGIAWFLSVLFAYVTNRKWVFASAADTPKAVAAECASFFGSRIFTGLCDAGLMFLCVTLLHWNDKLCKLLINVLVIVLNFVLSKLFVFRRR